MTQRPEAFNAIDAYLADLTEEEQIELRAADTAIDLAALFYRARTHRRLTQADAARLSGLKQQAVSRFERIHPTLANTKFETLRRYLVALDFAIEITLKDAKSGAPVERFMFAPDGYEEANIAPTLLADTQRSWPTIANAGNTITPASPSGWPTLSLGNTVSTSQAPAVRTTQMQRGEAA
jgi:transcriptional regulator with XRE-family HTH domain